MTIWQARPKWLGGTSRAPYSRRIYRAKRRAFLRANWKLLGAVLVFFTGLGSLVTWALDGYLLGAAHATIVFTYVGMTVSVFHAMNPRMVGQLAGAWGERTRGISSSARNARSSSGAGSTVLRQRQATSTTSLSLVGVGW